MSTDAELLYRYAKDRDERAFAELVHRHLGLVYGAALRRTGGRHALAEEIAQGVFADLARKAARLTGHPTIAGWLYRSTRYVAIDAIRSEQSREKLARSLTLMPDELSPAECSADWEQLRPVIDAVVDELKEHDREVILLRFFQGLTFAEVGAKLDLTENAARMRSERALAKLRHHLRLRGMTSTATLAGLLTSRSLVAAPSSLAASITSAALTTVPSGAMATLIAAILMNKIAVGFVSAALAATITSVAWATLTDRVSDRDLDALRAENARLALATAAYAPTSSAIAVADEFAAQAAAIVRKVDQRLQEKSAAGTSQYRDHGQATPRDAFLTYCWSLDTSDGAALAKILTYDEKGRAAILSLHASMPAAVRAHFATPEEFVVFIFLAHTLLNPIPGADLAEKFVATETGPGRAAVRPPGATQGGMNWIQTADGWKLVVPNDLPDNWAKQILGSEMLDRMGVH